MYSLSEIHGVEPVVLDLSLLLVIGKVHLRKNEIPIFAVRVLGAIEYHIVVLSHRVPLVLSYSFRSRVGRRM